MAVPSTDIATFHTHLLSSPRILALLGARLSASSGLPTFRGAGGLWRTHSAPDLATSEAFAADSGLVWQFYSYRRHMALAASPNAAHYALAELARRKPGFQCLSQNVDGLSPRAGHPEKQLQLLHGSLFEVKCVNERECGYRETNFTDPIVPALAIPQSGGDPTSNSARDLDISNIATPLPHLNPKDLPTCPHCASLLRPAVVWFGESLPRHVLQIIDTFLSDPEPTDLIMVIGTSAQVFPAAGYIQEARDAGARVCVVNMDAGDSPPTGWAEGDWVFRGDAAEIVSRLLEVVVGDVREGMENARAKV
ncbi:DHS-like NAD/FAD-binding domain-containing protein [Teratosphaeria nubilosa]|uniref:DHS-like NAD/FAD-binding domain-containing protein n=1 Tax=Teratosphaeria nubilosa TaxID=161662 RepID=A0A6G1LIJ7_9PEZI|nr:DHS-like NAD/FAD-binding domain-containing protein [Teratosphaeria nubilosa]